MIGVSKFLKGLKFFLSFKVNSWLEKLHGERKI
jgi:hypothetical protein